MNRIAFFLTIALICLLLPAGSPSKERSLTATARNKLDLARPAETIVLAAKDLLQVLKTDDLRKIHVKEESGRELLIQAIDMNGDSVSDELIFQADFKPREIKSFSLAVGAKQIPSKDQFKAYGRFVRERYDDFAWENDRIAHRMYGTALETWEKEPLTSSAVDVWCKRVRQLVINDWYMVDNYHEDMGEGGDFYSAGKSRGCGGSGIWEAGKLFVSRNFTNSKVIANGPIRIVFELTYAPWDVNGSKISEVKRVTLDAGQNMDRFESFYKTDGKSDITYAAGIKKNAGSTVVVDKKAAWLRTWEPLRPGTAGNLGCGISLDPALLIDSTEADGNYLIIARAPSGRPATYYAGFGWDKSGDFPNAAAWEAYLAQFAQRTNSPLEVSVSSK